jgi:hypothetical protein
MLEGAATTIQAGIQNLRHFEEIALFGEQIGPDRIGDMTCNVLKSDFICYTQDICRELGVPMIRIPVKHSDWDPNRRRWLNEVVELPLNPFATELARRPIAVLLTPKEFLRTFPSVDPMEFWDFAMSEEGEQLRMDLNYEIGQHVDRGVIVRLARRHPSLLRRYLESLEEAPKEPYDIGEDPDFIVQNYEAPKEIAAYLQASTPGGFDSLDDFVEKLVRNFKECIEFANGWRLLWTEDRPRKEKDAQTMFWNSARMACAVFNVEITPEAETGRGPVDFKLTANPNGASEKVLIELKYAKSSSFWVNAANQLPLYMKAQSCNRGYFIVLQFNDRECSDEFTSRARTLAEDVARQENIDFRLVFVDARPKASASIATR